MFGFKIYQGPSAPRAGIRYAPGREPANAAATPRKVVRAAEGLRLSRPRQVIASLAEMDPKDVLAALSPAQKAELRAKLGIDEAARKKAAAAKAAEKRAAAAAYREQLARAAAAKARAEASDRLARQQAAMAAWDRATAKNNPTPRSSAALASETLFSSAISAFLAARK